MPADIATLLAEAPWLARLARSLTGDPAEADDLVQDTYAAALRSPPDTDRPIRPWLRRVATNLVRMRHRTRTRRASTESVVEIQAEPVRDAEQLLERARLERRLAELVLELDEPFRTTVLLRYREGLTAERIANQQGIPAGTVRSRLKTALDRLRRELVDDEKRQLHALFAPLAAAARSAPAKTVWRLVMAKLTSKLAIVIALALLLLAGTWLVWPRSSKPGHGADSARDGVRELIAKPALFVQAGVSAHTVRGKVTSDGAPYRDAVVQLVHAETEVVLAEVHSGADGTFDFGDRPADRYVVTASAPGRASLPVHVDLRLPATKVVELRLTGCSHLRGTVVDGSGAPIDHARIARDDAPGVFAETDKTGHYDLCTRYGTAAIRYSASGYHGVVISVDVAASSRRDVVLIPEAIVEGTVVDEQGTPVGGAWIVIEPPHVGFEHDARATGVSARDGTFRLVGVAPGRNLIAGFAPGLRSPHKQELVLGAAQVTSGVIVRLARSATIAGVVVSGGAPVAGVGVGMRIGNRDATGVLAVTQADGSFVIDRAPRGTVALYVENHTVIAPRSIRSGDEPRVQIEVQRMGSVHGRVLRGNDPVPDAQVTCPGRHRVQVFSDASGAYRCDGVDDGPQQVTADVATGEWGRATVTVTRGENASVDIPLAMAGAICGHVVDQQGAPIGGLEVRVAEVKTRDAGKDTTGDDGAFCARLLTGGTYNVVVYDGPRALVPVVPLAAVALGPTETKTITIAVDAPTLSITGSVTDPNGGPVVDATIRLVTLAHGMPVIDARMPSKLVLSDEAGRFTLSKLAPGDYAIVATARDGSAVIKSPVAAGSSDVAITLAAAGRIEGDLVGFSSPPTITGQAIDDRWVLVDAEVDGSSFRASGLSPGSYVLMALTDAREADTRQVVVRPGETTHVTLTSRGTSTVTGVVRDFRTRAPVTGMSCSPFARDGDAMGAVYAGPDEAAPTDAQGAFRLTAPAGDAEITCGGAARIGARMLTLPRDTTIAADVLTVAFAPGRGTIDAELAFASNRIVGLTKGGAADSAGLAVGDEIVAVDGLSVVDLFSEATMLFITQRPAGSTAQLAIQRGSDQRNVSVTVRSHD